MAFDSFLRCLRIGFDGELGEFGAMGSRMHPAKANAGTLAVSAAGKLFPYIIATSLIDPCSRLPVLRFE